ncbi:MAG: hypothetical protein ACTSXC_07510 [Candidatus Freyarchaeota archaeon]
MTHTHHRRGDRKSLSNDYVILAMVSRECPEQVTYKGPIEARVKKFVEICAKHNPVALGATDMTTGKLLRWMKGWEKRMDSGFHKSATIEEITRAPGRFRHAVYTNKEDVLKVVRELKEADLGFSVVVSGLFDEVFDICKKAGTGPHTVNLSLGTWGRTDLLPPEPILSLITMCGHAMISRHLVEHLIKRVKAGKMTPEEAAVEMGKQCTCNIFNVERAARIIREYLGLTK